MSALLNRTRRQFECYGTTLTAWARDQGISRSDARSSLTRCSGSALRSRIVAEAAARARRPMRGGS